MSADRCTEKYFFTIEERKNIEFIKYIQTYNHALNEINYFDDLGGVSVLYT